jgi:UDP-3-O-[3-hydroxymyristoyl] glucosamine N-acyltransferase
VVVVKIIASVTNATSVRVVVVVTRAVAGAIPKQPHAVEMVSQPKVWTAVGAASHDGAGVRVGVGVGEGVKISEEAKISEEVTISEEVILSEELMASEEAMASEEVMISLEG